jgi:hypothetical protein
LIPLFAELNNAAPGAGSGLYLEQAKAANKKTFADSGKGLARNVGFVARHDRGFLPY